MGVSFWAHADPRSMHEIEYFSSPSSHAFDLVFRRQQKHETAVASNAICVYDLVIRFSVRQPNPNAI